MKVVFLEVWRQWRVAAETYPFDPTGCLGVRLIPLMPTHTSPDSTLESPDLVQPVIRPALHAHRTGFCLSLGGTG
jgi:hypothetical protein